MATTDISLDHLPTDADIRLVVADMDGTLLNERGEVPPGFWPLLETMRDRGILFAPASGRQAATLLSMFGHLGADMPIIAENGCLVLHEGALVSANPIDRDLVAEVVEVERGLRADGADLGLVYCGMERAYTERHDARFMSDCARYFAALRPVDDALALDDRAVKLAVNDFGHAAETVAHFERFTGPLHVMVSGPEWVDIIAPGSDKGTAVRALRERLGVTRAQTVVFGDYLNDLPMMAEADWSFAMANALPPILEAANHRAPANSDAGVVRVLSRLLGL